MSPSITAIRITRTSIIDTAIRFLCALVLGLAAAAAQAAPYVPGGDDVILEHLPVKPSDPIARELKDLRAGLAANPNDPDAALRLAQRYFDLAGAEGDPRYVGYAEAALKPWWKLADPPIEIRVMRAVLNQYSHDFPAAMKDLDVAVKEDPRNSTAWSWRAAIYMVQANYAQARVACEAMRGVESDFYITGCLAYIDSTTGKAAAAHRALADALARNPGASPEEKVWAQTRLAEMSLRQGDEKQAEGHFRAALALGVRDQYLLGAWSDFLLDTGRPAEVIPLLKEWVRSDILLLRLALAEKAVGAPEAKEHIQALKDRFDAAALRGDKLHLQEEARCELYLLGNRERALALAAENWTAQREPRDARIFLEAALAAKDAKAAQPALNWLDQSGHEDPYLRQLAAKLKALKP